MLEMVMPKNYVNLAAGLVSLVFDRLGQVSEQIVARQEPEVKPISAPEPKATPKAAPEPSQKPDDLTVINGIGPTFARRLNEAGIDTFAKLAAAQPEEVKAVAKLADWQADPANWITEAKQKV